jgi:thiosulfate/3-mercaptopyruvate sulfurtransferase
VVLAFCRCGLVIFVCLRLLGIIPDILKSIGNDHGLAHLCATPKKEFAEKHIPGAQFFDITALNDPHSDLPNLMSLDPNFLNEKLSAMGIRNDYKIIFYDNSNLHTSCRALWMFKCFGHNTNLLYVLDGGLEAWTSSAGKVESGEVVPSAKQYTVNLENKYLRTLAQVKENLKNPTEQIVDLRHPVRFCGGPEAREGLRSGHIPGSFSFPYFCFFEKDGTFITPERVRRKFMDTVIDYNSPIVTTCGSGMTAPILDFLLDIMGHTQHAVYNASWNEWGANKLYPGETSLDERPVDTCLEELNDIPQA